METPRPADRARRTRRLGPAFALVAAGLLSAACGGAGSDPEPATGAASSEAASSEAASSEAASSEAAGTAEGGALPAGEYVGRFAAVDADRAVGTLTVRCPPAAAGTRYRVDLGGGTFEDASNPADPARGHAVELTLPQWAAVASTTDWNVTLTEPGSPVLVRSDNLPSDHTVC
jgi:hypothetical protein